MARYCNEVGRAPSERGYSTLPLAISEFGRVLFKAKKHASPRVMRGKLTLFRPESRGISEE